ncbi:hypothetical protein [Streptomyces sp. NPDC056154]|uniref:hypothetical protein n=1 Tax=unclassified Streptomyces TaxID=2593676 RepID=UPI0035DFFE7D
MSGLVGGRAGPGASQCDDDGHPFAVQQVDTVGVQAACLSRMEGGSIQACGRSRTIGSDQMPSGVAPISAEHTPANTTPAISRNL